MGEALAKKFSGAITKELDSPAILTDGKKLSTALAELAEGYQQFSEDDLDTVAKSAIPAALKGAEAITKKRQAEEEEKNADKLRIAELEKKIRQLQSDKKTLEAEIFRLESSRSRVQPSYNPPPSSGGGYRSYGGKFAKQAKAIEILNLTGPIKDAYPDATQEDLKASLGNPKFLKDMHGPMPPHSTLSAPVVQTVKTGTTGSFIICYGADKTSRSASTSALGQDVIAIVKRTGKSPNGEDRYSVIGGYIDLGTEESAGEQPADGAVRELKRKVINAEGEAVIAPDAARLTSIKNASGIDYSSALPVNYNGHGLELNARELAQLTQHAKQLEESTEYRKAVEEKSGDTYTFTDVIIVPISEVIQISRESFVKPYEFDAVQQLAVELKQKALQNRRG